MIVIDNVSFRWRNGREVLRDVSAKLPDSCVTAVLGPNASGKTTLFRCMLGSLKPSSGQVLIGGVPVHGLPPRKLAEKIAYVPQSGLKDFDGTVLEAVLPGLTRETRLFSVPGREQTEKVYAMLEGLGLGEKAGQSCRALSGGERQLTLIARALVQDAEVLLMDEPDASLDFGNRIRLMDRVRSLKGRTVIFSTHDPALALDYSDHALLLLRGQVLACGPTTKLPVEEHFRHMYGLPVCIEKSHGTYLIYREDGV